jgi:hypothetical protein
VVYRYIEIEVKSRLTFCDLGIAGLELLARSGDRLAKRQLELGRMRRPRTSWRQTAAAPAR